MHLRGEIERPRHHGKVERKQQQCTEQPEFLADHGEYEIGGAFRQELQLSLRTLQVALSGDAARTDRDGGLDDVVARAERIVLRIEEGEHALLLVVVQQVPAAPGCCDAGAAEQRDDPSLQPGEQHDESARYEDQ